MSIIKIKNDDSWVYLSSFDIKSGHDYSLGIEFDRKQALDIKSIAKVAVICAFLKNQSGFVTEVEPKDLPFSEEATTLKAL